MSTTAEKILTGTADWLEALVESGEPLTLRVLSSGPLGEALLLTEIEPLVNSPDEVRSLIAGIRLSAGVAGQMEAGR